MERIGRAGIVIVVTLLAFAYTLGAAEPPATVPTSQPVVAGADWPQWRGPNRDGIAVNSPKLLDAWPKDGPPLLWKSDFIPAFRDGGCGSPVVADGKVFVYVNKLPVDGGDSFKFVTADLLADWGWMPDIPEDLAKKLEAAWASPSRPDCKEWNWLGFERSKMADLDAFLAKKPEADKYIKDFIATLKPEDAKKLGDLIRIRLCSKKAGGNDGGLTWDELAKLSKLQGVGHGSSNDWAAELRKVVNRQFLTHHIGVYPLMYALWARSFTWSDTLVCLDAATGRQLWKKSFPVDSDLIKKWRDFAWGDYLPRLGSSGTPAVWGDKCYFAGTAALYCLSAKDGTLLWQVKGGPEHASPLVANGVVYHIGCAYDAETGKLLWKSPFDLGKKNNGRYSSPLLWASGGKNYVITTDAANDSSYVCLDAETGKVNWKVKSCVLFNTIIHDDILVAPLGENTPLSHAYKITPAGAELLWKGRFNTFSWGGLVYQDHLYGGHGQLFCASMKSGEVNWKVGGQDSFSAQIVADGKMFGIHDRADVETVPFEMIKATPEKHTVLGRFEPQAIPMCQPALANGRLYIRIKDAIACYDVREHGVYLDGVTATKDALTFRFKQTGGGLAARADGGLKDIQIVDAAGAAKPAQARIDGDNVVVDVKDVSMPFRVSCAANTLAGRNGQPVPAFGWNEARVLKYRKAVDQIIVLKSDIPLQQVGPWDKAQTFAVAGAKVTKVELDPQGKGVSLTTDKTWKPGDAIVLTYPGFPADQGDARRETLKITVAEFQPPAARFVRSDTTTSGDWKGKYGSEGVMIAGDKGSTQAPKCATVAVRNHSDEVPWAASAKDPTKLQLTGDNPGRSVVCWSAGDQLFLDIEITDGKEHQVAAYLVFGNCPVSVESQDADTKAVLDTQADKGDVANKYLIWNIKGSVTLCISSTAESAEARAARIGGVFFDPPAPATQPAK